MSNKDKTKKVVLITGGSGGIGKAIAMEFAGHDDFGPVLICGRDSESLKSVSDEIGKKGHPSSFYVTDVSRKEDCEIMVEKIKEEYGRVDVLVNNAGISMRALFENTDLKVIEQLMNTNFWGSVYCTHYTLPLLIRSRGIIVVVSSIAGFKGLPGRTGYSASKFALHGFFESLRSELNNKGVHILLACPGYTTSRIRERALTGDGTMQGETPLREESLMSAEEVAIKIFHAAKEKKRTLILGFEGRLMVFLNKFFPAWIDKKVYAKISREQGSPFR